MCLNTQAKHFTLKKENILSFLAELSHMRRRVKTHSVLQVNSASLFPLMAKLSLYCHLMAELMTCSKTMTSTWLDSSKVILFSSKIQLSCAHSWTCTVCSSSLQKNLVPKTALNLGSCEFDSPRSQVQDASSTLNPCLL